MSLKINEHPWLGEKEGFLCKSHFVHCWAQTTVLEPRKPVSKLVVRALLSGIQQHSRALQTSGPFSL